MGVFDTFEFIVVESPVLSIEVVKDPDITEIKNGYYPDFKGMQLKVTYSDNTEKIITLNDDNTIANPNFNMGVAWYVKDGDNLISIGMDWDFNDDMMYKIQYFAAAAYYYGITHIDNSYDQIIVKDECLDVSGEGLTVVVDGETFVFDKVVFEIDDEYESETHVIGYKKTEDGLMVYSMMFNFDYNGYVTGCDVYVFGRSFSLDIMSGDINGDGVVDVRDLVAAKKAAADMTVPQNKFNADMNLDGKFDASDLPLYVKYLLGVHA